MNPGENSRGNGLDSLMVESKFCAHCKQSRLISNFNLRRRGGTSRQSYCRDCMRDAVRTTRAMQKKVRR